MTTDQTSTQAQLNFPVRMKAAMAYMSSAVSLLAVTIFAVMDGLRPFLEGAGADSTAGQEILAGLYPFEGVNEVRMIYAALIMIPVVMPLISGSKITAWGVLVLSILLTLINIEDAIMGHMLEGQFVFGLVFVMLVAIPALIGMVYAYKWARE